MTQSSPFDFGPQPLGDILDKHQLKSTDLVRVSTEQLNHKMVQKGRKGRRLTLNVQTKILNALNKVADEQYQLKDLFNY